MSLQMRRTGLIATKVGMTQIFDSVGNTIAVTLLKADTNVVLDSKTKEKNGYTAVVLGYEVAKPTRVSKSIRGICAKAGVEPVKHIKEFRVSVECLLNKGDRLALEHFVIDQNVDIHGVNTGKGFAGGMKRHNFRGLEASHGVSVSHRSHGSTGNRQDPGRTFPGKKMAGHMGTEVITIQNMKVVAIDSELGVIAVNGSVPGKKGSYVYLTDAVKIVAPSELQYPAALLVEQQAVAEHVSAPETVDTIENKTE